MHAIGIRSHGQIRPIIHDEKFTQPAGNFSACAGATDQGSIISIPISQLDDVHRAIKQLLDFGQKISMTAAAAHQGIQVGRFQPTAHGLFRNTKFQICTGCVATVTDLFQVSRHLRIQCFGILFQDPKRLLSTGGCRGNNMSQVRTYVLQCFGDFRPNVLASITGSQQRTARDPLQGTDQAMTLILEFSGQIAVIQSESGDFLHGTKPFGSTIRRRVQDSVNRILGHFALLVA